MFDYIVIVENSAAETLIMDTVMALRILERDLIRQGSQQQRRNLECHNKTNRLLQHQFVAFVRRGAA